jgi:hypothetical protein
MELSCFKLNLPLPANAYNKRGQVSYLEGKKCNCGRDGPKVPVDTQNLLGGTPHTLCIPARWFHVSWFGEKDTRYPGTHDVREGTVTLSLRRKVTLTSFQEGVQCLLGKKAQCLAKKLLCLSPRRYNALVAQRHSTFLARGCSYLAIRHFPLNGKVLYLLCKSLYFPLRKKAM